MTFQDVISDSFETPPPKCGTEKTEKQEKVDEDEVALVEPFDIEGKPLAKCMEREFDKILEKRDGENLIVLIILVQILMMRILNMRYNADRIRFRKTISDGRMRISNT